ncbi:DUF1289 domain-containing protein [Aliikangiella maris]|uniref:DUF1289 domain-containing protein n=2 Tax=Aliikangiella maris TaxID=3162458 RepID=A0ABV3MNX3_9GAMM
MTEPSANTIPSPCISQCCLDEQDVCVGCHRHIDEITGWHGADNQKREQILKNCSQRKQQKKHL